ncbi:hypothetical protein [Oceanithermus sp.]
MNPWTLREQALDRWLELRREAATRPAAGEVQEERLRRVRRGALLREARRAASHG